MIGDRIELRNLAVDLVIGVHAWEQRVHQTLYLDLDLPTDAARAARHDALEDALDYSAVADCVRRHAARNDAMLIETFAERLARQLLDHFQLPWLRLTVHKPGAVSGCKPVRLIIERQRTA